MEYRVLITSDAEEDLDTFIKYLMVEKKSEQAASHVLDDFETGGFSNLSELAGVKIKKIRK